jgi:hypothetical protein
MMRIEDLAGALFTIYFHDNEQGTNRTTNGFLRLGALLADGGG